MLVVSPGKTSCSCSTITRSKLMVSDERVVKLRIYSPLDSMQSVCQFKRRINLY